jgi:hypothetical protein
MSKKGNCLLLTLVAFSLAIIFQASSSTSEAKPGYYASGYMGKINASVAAAPLSGDFETPPILKASEYLPEKIRKSRYHTVGSTCNMFFLDSPGPGKPKLMMRRCGGKVICGDWVFYL